ncbi:DUF3050 domain-containing protein [Endozoicomonas sp. SCSIO W0465]|uniref:DUF3050 domain-containing protein n=1 Tax=Endozoicomonas sp. SCSIO W0465 TaxID=2918516 RepID=UPI002075461A|nr:DUF3050 domain-containing protein [Endozoicomonas sp. SCSIO W0465]USE35917.1 DUF3050 domain-containing protein [Endozoicomonas sp. SCSIO W0465]
MFAKDLRPLQEQLFNHAIYQKIDSLEKLSIFMEAHVFTVWDFMSLAKRLQLEFTSMQLPWAPVPDVRSARFINEIILYEETDKDLNGIPMSHLEMYLAAMREVSADTSKIEQVIYSIKTGVPWQQALVVAEVPEYIQAFVSDTLKVAQYGSLTEVTSYFLFGREDAIPGMFSSLLNHWDIPQESVPAMTYYLNRHIDLDGNEHGPAAEGLLKQCINGNKTAEASAVVMAKEAISSRIRFWDGLEKQLGKVTAEEQQGSAHEAETIYENNA